MNKTDLLDRFARDGESRLLLARILDQQQRAQQRSIPTHTGFLSPAQQAESARPAHGRRPGAGPPPRGDTLTRSGSSGPSCRTGWRRRPGWPGRTAPSAPCRSPCPGGQPHPTGTTWGPSWAWASPGRRSGTFCSPARGPRWWCCRETAPILLSQWTQAGKYPVKLAPLPPGPAHPHPGGAEADPGHGGLPPAGRGVSAGSPSPEPGGRPDPAGRWR